jgi:hypothetical protein
MKTTTTTGIAILAAIHASAHAMAPSKAPISPRAEHILLAQLTYDGYMSCREDARTNCEIVMNRKKASIKQLCYSMWTGKWPAGTEPPDAATYQMYAGWCSRVQEEIKLAAREYPPMLKFVSQYRGFNPSDSDPRRTLNALRNSETFLLKCTSNTAQRVAGTMELWGTTKHGDWTVRQIDDLVPSRYSEIISACGKKSWVQTLVTNATPILISSWSSLKETAASLSCLRPAKQSDWNDSLLAAETAKKDELEGFLKISNILADSSAAKTLDSSQLNEAINGSKTKLNECEAIIATGEDFIAKENARLERKRQAKAAAEAEKARRAAEAKAAAERNAAAARAEAARRDAAARAAAEAQRQRAAEREKLIKSVGF